MTNDSPKATTTEASAPPVIGVTRGNPTAEEVAAVTVLLAAMGGGGQDAEPNLRRGWARPSRRFSLATAPGFGWSRR